MTMILVIILVVGAALGFIWAYRQFELYSWKSVLWLFIGGCAIIGVVTFIEWESGFLNSSHERIIELTKFLTFQGYHGSRSMALLLFGYISIIWSFIATVLNCLLKRK